MGRFNAEFKEALLKKVFTRNSNVSISEIAIEANITPKTLYSWIRKSKGMVTVMKNDNYKAKEKFEYCLEYFNLSENQKGIFLRSNGLYSYQLDAWKEEFINSNSKQQINDVSKNNKKKIKSLEKDLRRKEKALAEMATLLTLKKKFQELDLDEE